MRKWGLIFLGWALLAVIFGLRDVLADHMKGIDTAWSQVMLTVLGILTWAVLTPAVAWLSRRFPLADGTFARSLPVHLVALLLVIPIDVGVYYALDLMVFRTQEPEYYQHLSIAKSFWITLIRTYPFSVFYYGGTVGLCHAIGYYGLVRDREIRASQLEARLAQAQLQVLRIQLQPHFLFNTLNGISELLHKDPKAADEMLTRLADLLRLSLAYQGKQEVTVKEELELLSAYIGIEVSRFRDRLTVEQQIAPEALDALVPSLLLQPLVENAIRHGIQPRSGLGRIVVTIQPDHEHRRLGIQIRDNGRGLPSSGGKEGLGIGNTRARLQHLYGDDHHFQISNAKEGGVIVEIAVPFRSAAVI